MLSLQGARVRSLVGELRSHKPRSAAKKKVNGSCLLVTDSVAEACPGCLSWHLALLAALLHHVTVAAQGHCHPESSS